MRYSFLGLRPDLIWRCLGNRAEINQNTFKDPDNFQLCPIASEKGAIASLRAMVDQSGIDLPDDMPPMAAGLMGYLGYDCVRLVEDIPDGNAPQIDLPDGQFMRPTVIAVFDTIEDTVRIVTPIRPEAGLDAQAAYARATARLAQVLKDFERPLPPMAEKSDAPAPAADPVSNVTQETFHRAVERGKEYILAGDVFQVVLSQCFSIPFAGTPLTFYRALRRINPSPFSFHLDFRDFAIIGSSPELLVRLRGGRITIRPLAGTHPRGKTAAEDKALAEELLSDPKELAEHLPPITQINPIFHAATI